MQACRGLVSLIVMLMVSRNERSGWVGLPELEYLARADCFLSLTAMVE